MGHSLFAPSAAHRWLHCAASVAHGQHYPSGYSDFADEGTAAHTLAQRALDHGKDAHFFLGEQIQPRTNSKVYVVDDDMANYVQLYLDEIRGRKGADGLLMVEEHSKYADDQGGTSDAIIVSGDGKTLTIADLKYGMGVKVSAQNNPQMKAYALGAMKKYDLILDSVEKIVLLIVQPRIDHIDECELTPDNLIDYEMEVAEAIKKGRHAVALLDCGQKLPEEYYAPDDKVCRWCPHKVNCDVLRKHVSMTVFNDFAVLDDAATAAVIGTPKPPAGDKLGALFGGALDMIEDWVRACRAEAERQVIGGMTVIGPDGLPMKLIEGRAGNRSWTEPDVVIGLASGLLPRDKVFNPETLRTPAQIEKALGKKRKADWEALVPYTKRAQGRPKVVTGSTPGTPWTGTATADEFTTTDEE